jgi:phosphoglycerol geranylgeranyltransferase
VEAIKSCTDRPVILFPGSSYQLSPVADAVLFLTLVSSRNPEYLISEQVKAAPQIKKAGLEAIPTGYILIESGRSTSVGFISNSQPIPMDKLDIAKAHALAAQYMGMRLIYLEAGSGAMYSVPEDLIREVDNYTDIPIIVGGGISTPKDARNKVIAGANHIVIGNHFEQGNDTEALQDFADAIHCKQESGIEIER